VRVENNSSDELNADAICFRDRRDVKMEKVIKYFPTMSRRMRQIPEEWWVPCLDKVNRGVAIYTDLLACKWVRSKTTVQRLLHDVTIFHFTYTILIFVNSVSTVRRCTPPSVLGSHTPCCDHKVMMVYGSAKQLLDAAFGTEHDSIGLSIVHEPQHDPFLHPSKDASSKKEGDSENVCIDQV